MDKKQTNNINRNVMAMMGPRYNAKYESATINSLNKTYLNALQAAVDGGHRSVVFTELHRLDASFAPRTAAEVVVRTLRRFFEHYPAGVDVLCLALGADARAAYEEQLARYFPRSAAEAVAAEAALPRDVGNEWGERAAAARSIRISALPGMGGDADDYEGDDADQAPAVVGAEPPAHELAQEQPSPDARATQGVRDPRSPHYIPPGYASILARAAALDLGPLERAGFFAARGPDALARRSVALFVGRAYADPALPPDRVLPFLARALDTLSLAPFTLVYLHSPLTNSAAGVGWLHSIASAFPRRCITNMHLAVVYPTFWLRTHLRLARFGALRGIADISYYDNLAALFRVVSRDVLRVPDDILNADISVQSESASSSSSAAAPASPSPAARRRAGPLVSDDNDDNL